MYGNNYLSGVGNVVYGFQASLHFSTQTARDAVYGWLFDRLQTEALWQPPQVIQRAYQGNPALRIRASFTTAAARNSFWADLEAGLAGVDAPLTGSKAQSHNCTHDEGDPLNRQPCLPGASRVW